MSDWEPVNPNENAGDWQPVEAAKPEASATPTASITMPQEPMQTAYLADKDVTVEHPASMSHDQVNDAVQNDIYGRPRNQWFNPEAKASDNMVSAFKSGLGTFILGPEALRDEKTMPEVAKGAVRGAEAIPAQLGGLLEWFGNNLEDQAKFNNSDFAKKLGSATAEIGENARTFWQDRQAEGWEAPDPEVFRGAFLSNPSFTRLAAGVAQGIPVLGAAALVGHASLLAGASEEMAALAGAGGLGLLSGGETYASSKEHGTGTKKASILAAGSTVGNAVLMAIPFGKVLGKSIAKSTTARIAEGAFSFGAATGALTPFNNIIAKLGGDKARKLFDGMTESILAAAVSGGILGGFSPGHGQLVDQMIQEAHNAGVPAKDIDAARKTIADQLILNASKVEKRLKEMQFESKEDFPTKEELSVKFKKVTPDEFIQQREKSIKAEFITPYTADEMKGWDLYLTDDGVGFGLTPEKDMVSIFNNSGRRGAGREALVYGISEGAKTLDCISGFLGEYYNNAGFDFRKSVKWNNDYAPKNWNYEQYGTPDIVYFVYPESLSRETGIVAQRIEAARAERLAGNSRSEEGQLHDSSLSGRPEYFDWSTWREVGDGKQNPPLERTANSGSGLEFHAIGGGATENKYVKFEPFKVRLGQNDKQTSRNIREQFTGQKNEQITRGNQLADKLREILPNELERQGLFWFKAADGDANKLLDALDNPKFEPYKDQIMSALRASPQQQKALKLLNKYYEEAGQVGKESGTLRQTRDNYMARLYAPDKPEDFIKTEMSSGIKQSTSHAKHRVFDTEFEAIEAGKKFATTDVADTLALHNEEMARVNTSRRMADSLAENGLAAWKRPDNIPDGWEQIGNLKKSVPIKDKNGEAVIGDDGNQAVSQSILVAPKGIAKGLSAIADPNFSKKIEFFRNAQKYQGLVKTVDLSYSFFHHLTMGFQTLYQGGVRTLLHVPMMEAHLASPDFADLEQDFSRHTGMTSKLQENQDILRNLTAQNQDFFSKVTNFPGVKQILDQSNKNAEFLFGHIQRYLKVTDYGAKISNWVADNPKASDEEVRAAKIGFAKEINAAYGGLNWEAMGMTKSNLSLLRLGLLAPDWTISNYELLKYAISENPFDKTATGGASARAHILTALVGGMVLTEGLNKILTGHFTDKNKKGHQLEVEIAPNVYVSMLRGGIGDITKSGSMIAESGLAGASRFLQGKLAPFPRTAIGLLQNVQYTGQPIAKKGEGPLMSSYDVLKYLLSSLAPVPLGVSNLMRYLNDEEKTWRGGVAVATGIGRYSKGKGDAGSYATHGLAAPGTYKNRRDGLL